MKSFRRLLISDKSGATIILVAVMLPLFVSLLAVTIDISRLYVVHSRAQTALDNALLSVLAPGGRISRPQAQRMFDVNFPRGYMGSRVMRRILIRNQGNGEYKGQITIRVPTTILSLGGNSFSTFTLTARAVRGFNTSTRKTLELALVVDNSRAMIGKMSDVFISSLINLFYTLYPNISSPNIFTSVVAYHVGVDIGLGRSSWIQPNPYQFIHRLYNRFGIAPASNRNADSPPSPLAEFTDFSDAPPLVPSARFRVPRGARTFTPGNDLYNSFQPAIGFSLNNIIDIYRVTRRFFAGSSYLRTNVGLMWGWYTLSPNWQGLFDAGQPSRPAAYSPLVEKSLVLVVGGKNSVFLGVNGTSDDRVSTRLLCSAIKGKGIQIHVIAYATSRADVDDAILSACATTPGDYFFVTNRRELDEAFSSIFGDIMSTTLHLIE